MNSKCIALIAASLLLLTFSSCMTTLKMRLQMVMDGPSTRSKVYFPNASVADCFSEGGWKINFLRNFGEEEISQ